MKISTGKLVVIGIVLFFTGLVLIMLRETVVSPMIQKARGIETPTGMDRIRFRANGTANTDTRLDEMDVWQGVIIVVGTLSFVAGLGIIGVVTFQQKLDSLRNDRGFLSR